MLRAGIVGANGYTGYELMRILSRHGKATLTTAVSRSNAGSRITDMYPALIPFYGDKLYEDLDVTALKNNCDVIFTALPHGASAEICGKLYEAGIKVIDLSADFRYDDIPLYQETYKVTHPCPLINASAVYGLTEINRARIQTASIVGNPGCYTTASILPLYPLIKEKLVSDQRIIIDAKSGVTGAGRKSDIAYNYNEVDGNFKAYAVTTHRHTTEIEEKLSFGPKRIRLSFTPHLLPLKRGILATIYADSTASPSEIAAVYQAYYGKERFVKVLPAGELPEIKFAENTNMCYIGYKTDEINGRVILVSVIDNLIKGASGQAVQNMNVMFGFAEDTGL